MFAFYSLKAGASISLSRSVKVNLKDYKLSVSLIGIKDARRGSNIAFLVWLCRDYIWVLNTFTSDHVYEAV